MSAIEPDVVLKKMQESKIVGALSKKSKEVSNVQVDDDKSSSSFCGASSTREGISEIR